MENSSSAGAEPDCVPVADARGLLIGWIVPQAAAENRPADWSPPQELPIHTAILRARPAVTAVVHAHPPAVVAMSLADLAFQPIFGAYDIPRPAWPPRGFRYGHEPAW